MIKTLGAYVKEFKRASIATPCYMILEVLMEMMIPYLMASIIDDGVNKGDMKHICVVGAGMACDRSNRFISWNHGRCVWCKGISRICP